MTGRSDGAPECDEPPDEWVVWNEEAGGPVTWVYRPETFDGAAFPAACIPTIHVSRRQNDRRPSSRARGPWRARLTLEPQIELDGSGACSTRQGALESAVTFARTFASGGYECRSAYHDAADRADYLAALSEAVGNGIDGGGTDGDGAEEGGA